MNPVHDRDAGRCVVFGTRAESVHHRVHGDRSNMRPSNLLSVSGSGTTAGHGWVESHWAAAEAHGWTVSKFDQRDLTEIPVWYEDGPFGRGWYLLNDDNGFDAWPTSVRSQELGLDRRPPPGEEVTP